jgi:hypothetical protein
MPVWRFRKLIDYAHNEVDVQRILLLNAGRLAGSEAAKAAALAFALERQMHFSGPAEGTKTVLDTDFTN